MGVLGWCLKNSCECNFITAVRWQNYQANWSIYSICRMHFSKTLSLLTSQCVCVCAKREKLITFWAATFMSNIGGALKYDFDFFSWRRKLISLFIRRKKIWKNENTRGTADLNTTVLFRLCVRVRVRASRMQLCTFDYELKWTKSVSGSVTFFRRLFIQIVYHLVHMPLALCIYGAQWKDYAVLYTFFSLREIQLSSLVLVWPCLPPFLSLSLALIFF